MSKNIIMNKKAQYYTEPSYSSVHPVLIVGIIMFVIPFMLPVVNIDAPSWINSGLSTLGIMCILTGGALSIFKSS